MVCGQIYTHRAPLYVNRLQLCKWLEVGVEGGREVEMEGGGRRTKGFTRLKIMESRPRVE